MTTSNPGIQAPRTLLAFFDEFFDDDRQSSFPASFNSTTVVVILSTESKDDKMLRDLQVKKAGTSGAMLVPVEQCFFALFANTPPDVSI